MLCLLFMSFGSPQDQTSGSGLENSCSMKATQDMFSSSLVCLLDSPVYQGVSPRTWQGLGSVRLFKMIFGGDDPGKEQRLQNQEL